MPESRPGLFWASVVTCRARPILPSVFEDDEATVEPESPLAVESATVVAPPAVSPRCQTPVQPLHGSSAQTVLPDVAEPQHIPNRVPFSIDGRRTQTRDSPDGSHVSISKGSPPPSMSTNARSAPVADDCSWS